MMLGWITLAVASSWVGDDKAAANPLNFAVPAERPAGTPRWASDYFEAMEEARQRNCPIITVLSHDGSTGFKTSWKALLSTPEFADLSERCVLVPAIGGTSAAAEERKVGDQTVAWCTMFDLAVADRVAIHARLLPQYDKEAFENPLLLVMDPYGVDLSRIEGHRTDLAMVTGALKSAMETWEGDTLSYSAYRAQLQLIRDAVDQREKRGSGRVVKDLRKLQTKGLEAEGLVDFAGKLERTILREGRARLDAAKSLAETDLESAKKEVSAVQRDYRDTDVAKEARALAKDLKER